MADSQNDDAGTATLDIDAASARIGETLLGPSDEPMEGREEQVTEQPVTPSPSQPVQATPATEPPVDLLPPPKSWRQDMHPYWGQIPRKAQEYYVEREKQMLDGMSQYKQIREVLTPFEQMLSEKGVSVYDWVRGLTQAERMLTQGTEEQRRAAYLKLGEQLGFTMPGQTQAQPEQPIDPNIKKLQDELAQIKSGLTAQQQAIYNETKTKVQAEVDAFANDPAHPHFDEVAEDMQIFIRSGLSLQDAYDRAVWANPATREKATQQRLTDELAKQKENARLAALPKKRATSVNVRGTDSGRAPTETPGRIEDTVKQTLREIRTRAS